MKIRSYIVAICCCGLCVTSMVTLRASDASQSTNNRKKVDTSVSINGSSDHSPKNKTRSMGKQSKKKKPVSPRTTLDRTMLQKKSALEKKTEKKKHPETESEKKNKNGKNTTKKKQVKKTASHRKKNPLKKKRVVSKHGHIRKNKVHTIYINFDQKKGTQLSGWSRPSDAESLSRWGLGHNLFLEEDKAPVIDGSASFVMPEGAHIRLQGLHANATYYLFLDPVMFKPAENMTIPSHLKIYIDGDLLEELQLGRLDPDHLHRILLPRDLTYDGKIDIMFEEYAQIPGFWGFWDIIVSTATEVDAIAPLQINPAKKKKSLKKITPKIQQRNRDVKKEQPVHRKKIDKSLPKQEKKDPGSDSALPNKQEKEKSVSSGKETTTPREPVILEPYVKEPVLPEIPKMLQPEK